MPTAVQVFALVSVIIAVLLIIIFLYASFQQDTTPTVLPAPPVATPETAPPPVSKPAPKPPVSKPPAPKPARKPAAKPSPAPTTTTPTTTTPATTKPATPNTPVLYDGKGFVGKTYVLSSGKTVLAGTNMSGETSAIRVPAGWEVTVFSDDKCTGKSATYRADIKSLEGTNFNNKIKCVIAGKTGAQGTSTTTSTTTGTTTGKGTIALAPAGKGPILHSDKKFMGKFLELVTGQTTLKGTTLMTDTSSITVPPGWTVEVYNEADCTGKSKTYTESVSTLEGTGFNNSIKCVRVGKVGAPASGPSRELTTAGSTTSTPISGSPAAGVPASGTSAPPRTPAMPVFYTDKNFAGKSFQPTAIGISRFKGLPIANAASSIRVPAGTRVTAYDKDDCTGKSAIFTSDVADLSGSGLNNDIACAVISSA